MSAAKKTGFFDASTLAPTSYDAELRQARAAVLEAVEGRGWQAHGTTDGVELFTNPASPFPATRGVTVVNAHPLYIHALFGDAQHRKSWDPMVEDTKLLDRVDRLTHVGYSLFKTVWPVSRRDMHIIGRGERLPSTRALLTYGCSLAHPPTPYPPPRSTIRAHLVYYGTLITPLGGGRCRIVFVGCSDPKGSLPNVLVAAAGKLQPLNINRVVAFSQREGIREETERKLMAAIREAGYDEEEGRFSDVNAAPAAEAGLAAGAGTAVQGGDAVDEEAKEAADGDKQQDEEKKQAESNSGESSTQADDSTM